MGVGCRGRGKIGDVLVGWYGQWMGAGGVRWDGEREEIVLRIMKRACLKC